VVDRVQEVLDIAGKNIEDTPQFGVSVNTDFILGMGKIGESVKILLNIDKVLASDDFTSFANVETQEKTKTEPRVETEAEPEIEDKCEAEEDSEPDDNTEAESESASEQ